MFKGDIVNVSAGEDVDKEGRSYREYFTNARSYTITNYSGATFRGYQGRSGEIQLDLTIPLIDSMYRQFDLVFNHTTLEHVFEVRLAVKNLCDLSRDALILVVPFCQVQHENEGYKDYWRFTPTCIEAMLHENGFTVIYNSCNSDFNTSIYLFVVASRFPERWIDKFPAYAKLPPIGGWIGYDPSLSQLFSLFMRKIKKLTKLY